MAKRARRSVLEARDDGLGFDYELVNLPRAERHRLTLNLDEGVSGYAFTFG